MDSAVALSKSIWCSLDGESHDAAEDTTKSAAATDAVCEETSTSG